MPQQHFHFSTVVDSLLFCDLIVTLSTCLSFAKNTYDAIGVYQNQIRNLEVKKKYILFQIHFILIYVFFVVVYNSQCYLLRCKGISDAGEFVS